MRLATLILIAAVRAASAAELANPLWDGHESVADYSKRVNLPPTQTLNLGGGVKLDLVLIPAGKFLMGTPEPAAPDDTAIRRNILTGMALLALSALVLLAMLVVVAVRALREKRRPQVSLGLLVFVTIAAGGCVLSALHWRHSLQALELLKAEYAAAIARYDTANAEEKPAHLVTLTTPLYMGKFAVTQEQWQQAMGQNPSRFVGNDNPVEMVSWDDAQAFCKKLTEQLKQTLRLPTEAEWEFACRAGTTTKYHSGEEETDLARAAWYDGNSKRSTHPVGQKEANRFGLYDMHGNVWQFCQDWYGHDYYAKSEAQNPQGPATGPAKSPDHVMRGGAWADYPKSCRSAHRLSDGLNFRRDVIIGFRVVMVPVNRTP